MKSLIEFVLVVNKVEIVEILAGLLYNKEEAIYVIFSLACASISLES